MTDWECFHHYLGCLLEDDCILKVSKSTDCQHGYLADDKFDSCILKATEFVKSLMAKAGNDTIRGPGLANLEIERWKILYGKGNAGKLLYDLILYFSRFGYLSIFTSNEDIFLQILPGDMKKQLLEKLVKCIESSSKPSRKVLGQHLTLFKIRELIGDTLSLLFEGKSFNYHKVLSGVGAEAYRHNYLRRYKVHGLTVQPISQLT